MNRRDILKSAGLLGLNLGMGSSMSTLAASLQQPALATHSSEPSKAFSNSFSSVPESYGPTQVAFDRPLPKALEGTLYRNGPARMHRGETHYHHWFDGDGMIHAFHLHNDSMTHNASMIRTDKYREEEQAGKFLRDGFGTHFVNGLSVLKPDDLNVANISVLPLGDELLALWEAGSAWRVDPDTLETLGRKVFSAQTDGVSFSAHPRVDPDGHVWNFGYLTGASKLVIYDINPNGALNRTQVIDAEHTNMVHDFAVTEHYLIFVLMPVTFDNQKTGAFSDRLGWDDESAVDVLVIDKATLNVQQRFELPAFFAFHFGNAWEDGKQVRIEVATSEPLGEFNTVIKQTMKGHLPSQAQVQSRDHTQTMEIVLDLASKRARTEIMPFGRADFPSFDNRFAGYRTQSLIMMTRGSSMPTDVFGFNQVSRFDRKRDRIVEWDYGDEYIAEEHVFVPKLNAKEGDGWLVGTAYDWKNAKTSLSVFDTGSLGEGPVAVCTLPYHLPLGLHGKFVGNYT